MVGLAQHMNDTVDHPLPLQTLERRKKEEKEREGEREKEEVVVGAIWKFWSPVQ